MMQFRKIFILWGSLFFPALVIAGWFGGPNDYDSCILENMKGVTSDVAAKMIRSSCSKKFPAKVQKSVELPDSALEKIEGHGNSYGDENYSVTTFNGNSEWNITALEIRITNKKTQAFRDYKSNEGFNSPMSSGLFLFETYEIPEDRSLMILKANGYQN